MAVSHVKKLGWGLADFHITRVSEKVLSGPLPRLKREVPFRRPPAVRDSERLHSLAVRDGLIDAYHRSVEVTVVVAPTARTSKWPKWPLFEAPSVAIESGRIC